MPRAHAIIVTHNSADYIRRAVTSCLDQDLAVTVVDNASTDPTIAQIPCPERVRIVRNSDNLGFAGAVNQGVDSNDASLLLLLNPDTELLDPIDSLVTFVESSAARAAAPLLVGNDDRPQAGFTVRRFPTPALLAMQLAGINHFLPHNPVNSRYLCSDLDLTQRQFVDQPAGACFLFRRDDWEKLGRFDPQFYPVWFEDVDFCKRLINAGGSILLDPSVRVRHAGGHSVNKVRPGLRQRYWQTNMLRYAAKHFKPWEVRLVAAVAMGSNIPRSLVSLFGGNFTEVAAGCAAVFSLSWQTFRRGSMT